MYIPFARPRPLVAGGLWPYHRVGPIYVQYLLYVLTQAHGADVTMKTARYPVSSSSSSAEFPLHVPVVVSRDSVSQHVVPDHLLSVTTPNLWGKSSLRYAQIIVFYNQEGVVVRAPYPVPGTGGGRRRATSAQRPGSHLHKLPLKQRYAVVSSIHNRRKRKLGGDTRL